MSAFNIYNKLRGYGMTHAGTCAMMGNLMAESSLIANIAQRGMTKLTDAEYTAKFDEYPETCYRDGVGYGLAQWTYWSRKQNLFEFANARGKSVGDENTQIDFAVHELRTEYSGLYSYLCSTDDMYEATARICKEYERPAVNNIDRRYQFAQTFDRDFAGEVVARNPAASFPPDQSILVLQAVLVANGYATEITGYKSVDFFEKLREFVHDIGG
ncbi:MAG: hypothetical protein IIX72_00610 [Oscillospiraceae bacterium]|nr:hypothetical protein [Oscillospiraceae bacterium]